MGSYRPRRTKKLEVIGILSRVVNCSRFRRPDYWGYADEIEAIYKKKRRRKK